VETGVLGQAVSASSELLEILLEISTTIDCIDHLMSTLIIIIK